MQEQLITFEIAKLAKEKGFNLESKNYCTKDGLLYESDNSFNLDWNDKNVSSEELTWDDDFPETHICYTAPTQSLLQKWLREKHNILVEPSWEGTHEIYSINYRIIILGNTIYKDFRGCFDGQSYEQALEVGLQEALKLIKI